MAATAEGKVKAKVSALLKQYGAYYHMPVQNGMGKPSLDYIVCHRGRFAGVETKAGNKLPTPRQEGTIAEMRAAGGATFIVNEVGGLDELRFWLEM